MFSKTFFTFDDWVPLRCNPILSKNKKVAPYWLNYTSYSIFDNRSRLKCAFCAATTCVCLSRSPLFCLLALCNLLSLHLNLHLLFPCERITALLWLSICLRYVFLKREIFCLTLSLSGLFYFFVEALFLSPYSSFFLYSFGVFLYFAFFSDRFNTYTLFSVFCTHTVVNFFEKEIRSRFSLSL